MNKHRFDARSWRIIKEYTGIYGTMSADDYKKLYRLPLGQLNKVCGKELGFQAEVLQPFVLPTYDYKRKRPTSWKRDFDNMYWNHYHPEEVKETRKIHERCGVRCRGEAYSIMPYLPPGTLPKNKIAFINKAVSREMIKAGVVEHNHLEGEGMIEICKKIGESPNRGAIYQKLKKAVKNPMQYCLCGEVVSKNTRLLEKHFKSAQHVKKSIKYGNLVAIDQWYQESGVLPPGFKRRVHHGYPENLVEMQHYIPADPKRTANHPIVGTGQYALTTKLNNEPSGRACRWTVVNPQSLD